MSKVSDVSPCGGLWKAAWQQQCAFWVPEVVVVMS